MHPSPLGIHVKPLLQTERASLRAFIIKDLPEVLALLSDAEIMKFTGFKTPQSRERVEELLNSWISESEKKLGVWAAELSESAKFIGWFMLKDTGKSAPEIGFMLSKSSWNQGLASEITKGLILYAKNIGLDKIIATCSPQNKASMKVLANCGFSLDSNHSSKELQFFQLLL